MTAADDPGSRVIANKHSTEFGALLTFTVHTHTNTQSIRWRMRRFNVERGHVFENPHTDTRSRAIRRKMRTFKIHRR